MACTESETKRILLNKEVMVVVKKSKIILPTKEVEIKNDFFIMENDREKVSIHKNNIKYVTRSKDTDIVKVGYELTIVTCGTVVNMDKVFMTIRVFDRKAASFYDYIFPIKCIEGLKVMEYTDEPTIFDVDD